MRKDFEMSRGQLDELLVTMKPVPYIIVGGVAPRSQQENANAAWRRLGEVLGFDHMTVKPNGKVTGSFQRKRRHLNPMNNKSNAKCMTR